MKSDLSKVNLNLLVALDALLKEKSVTQAGKRLHITQSAMSNLLKQLRELFNDPLFIRGQSSKLLPTPYALLLAPRLQEALTHITEMLHKPQPFVPEKAKHTFTIGLSDYTEFVLLPTLIQTIAARAPKVELIIKHFNYFENKSVFENETLDLAIGMYKQLPSNLIAQPLFTDQVVCVADSNNPLLNQPITLKQFAQAKQIVILYYQSREELMSEQWLRELGLERQVVVTVPHTLAALYSLPNTPFIVTALERVVKSMQQTLPLAYQKLNWVSEQKTIQMVWHPRYKNDPPHRWLRETVLEIGGKL